MCYLLLIDVSLRLVVDTEPYVFYFNSPLVISEIILEFTRDAGFGFNALVAIKKHRSLQIVFYKYKVRKERRGMDHDGVGMKFQC